MSTDPNDELAAYTQPTPEQTARADRLIAATRMTAADAALWFEDTAFLPPDPADTDRQRVGRTLTAPQLQHALDDMLRWPPPHAPMLIRGAIAPRTDPA